MADWETYINSFPAAATLSSQNLSDGPHSTLHGNLGAAINAWLIDAQAAMGSYTTFARKLAAITSANVVNPTSATYGAVGDGSTDDTTAIQAGLTALALIGGGVLVLPEGQFNVTGITVPSNVFIVGAGVGATTIHCTAALGTTVNFEGTYSALSSSSHCKNSGLRGVKITGTSTGVGINLEHASSLHLTDFRVDNVAYGIRAYGAWDSIIDGDWRVQECDYGLFYASHQNDAILSGVVDTNNIRHVGGTIESCYVTDITITGKGTDGTGTGAQKPNHITFDALKVESSFVQNQPRVILESVHAVRFQTPLFAWTNYDTSFSTPVHGVSIDGDSMQVTFASPSCTNNTTNVIDAWFYLNGTDFCTITDPMFLLNAAPSTAHIEFAGTNDRVEYPLDGLKLGPTFTPANLTISGTPTSVRQTYVRSDGQVEMTDDLILSDGYAAASTNYVDNAAAGLTWKDAVACATTANVTLSGEQTIDGVLTSTSRVLVKNQSTSHQNGIYVTAAGAWSRATDMDAGSEFPGAAVLVSAGTTLGGTAWTCTNTVAPTVGSTAITFSQFSGASSTLAGDVTGASSATVVGKIGGTVVAGTGASGTITATGRFAQTLAPTAATHLATKDYVDTNIMVHHHEIGSTEGQINFHDLEGLPQRFAPEVHAWNDAAIHAGPTLSIPVDLMAGTTTASQAIPVSTAAPGLEYSDTKRFRAPVDLSAARWLRALVTCSTRQSSGARALLRATVDAGATWTTLTDSTGADIVLVLPDASSTYELDTGVLDLHPSVQLLGNCTLAVWVYDATSNASRSLTISGCRLLIGVLG